MKTYTITIKVEELKSNKSFIDSLFAEAEDDKRQFALCEKINKATTKLHRQMFEDVLKSLNEDLERLGVKFTEPKQLSSGSNTYYTNSSSLFLKDRSFTLTYGQFGTSKVEGIKYMTFSGEPVIVINRYIQGCGNTSSGRVLKSTQEVLEYMKSDLINHIKSL